jgi:hypothetical protein
MAHLIQGDTHDYLDYHKMCQKKGSKLRNKPKDIIRYNLV